MQPEDQPTSESKSNQTRILGGKSVSTAIRQELAVEVASLVESGGRRPKLVAVLVGDDTASATYVASKARGCQEVGMDGETLRLPADIDGGELEATIRRLNDDDGVDGILVQLPLPKHIDEDRILQLIDPDKDVDGFHPVNVGRLWSGRDALAPATPTGVIELLQRRDIEIRGRHAVIVGRSNIVGKPMAALLLQNHATVTICHSRTADLAAECSRADILIAAVGVPALLGPEHVKDGAVVIDVGMNRVDDTATLERLYPGNEKRRNGFEKRGFSLVGDVDYTRVKTKASAITPVPGGVGLLTVTMVIANTLRASKLRQHRA
ncbi:MAG: bifunctional 5,10-methylenetetrahydrofolate dehydrogenase/5,10-methenyltetrahydrofolate cyclohydrolase [Thermoanaerobaculia bacterium]|nr:bifunctional 5,10-methylenetetrahydrofolate dehydrogenase/5,10-methenyltetrahydrofolate cyclohydrolase [Thermoanaerobaculia bacterium]